MYIYIRIYIFNESCTQNTYKENLYLALPAWNIICSKALLMMVTIRNVMSYVHLHILLPWHTYIRKCIYVTHHGYQSPWLGKWLSYVRWVLAQPILFTAQPMTYVKENPAKMESLSHMLQTQIKIHL